MRTTSTVIITSLAGQMVGITNVFLYATAPYLIDRELSMYLLTGNLTGPFSFHRLASYRTLSWN